ncbi:MAG TPA: DUF1330 domain-containing protein [Burkholderiaceae bacterium]|nr:DUF1330 domain-containing protein [Burkholderiaceae bacterium]
MSSAYVIADVKVADPDKYRQYQALTPQAVAAAGGEFVVRGGRTETLEGDWRPNRVVVLKFASYDAAKAFYESALYRQARETRAGATESFNMILVEGL